MLLTCPTPSLRHLRPITRPSSANGPGNAALAPVCPRRRRRLCATDPEQQPSPSSSSPAYANDTDDDDTLPIERQLAKRKPKAKPAPAPPPGSYKVISATRDAVYGDAPLTDAQKLENGVVSLLSFLFLAILLEGILLGGSGFMSEQGDALVMQYVYPAFSPTLGLFLACSTLYGLWKTGGGRSDDAAAGK